jgi:hypothetical protein
MAKTCLQCEETACCNGIKFPWQKNVLIQVLYGMGFTWKHSVSKRNVLAQRQDIPNWQSYLRLK